MERISVDDDATDRQKILLDFFRVPLPFRASRRFKLSIVVRICPLIRLHYAALIFKSSTPTGTTQEKQCINEFSSIIQMQGSIKANIVQVIKKSQQCQSSASPKPKSSFGPQVHSVHGFIMYGAFLKF